MESGKSDAIRGRLDSLTAEFRSMRETLDARFGAIDATLLAMQASNEAEHRVTRAEVAGVATGLEATHRTTREHLAATRGEMSRELHQAIETQTWLLIGLSTIAVIATAVVVANIG